MERRTNISIFLSACKELKVKVKFKNADPSDIIEKLDTKDWKPFLDILESFSEKFEAQLAKLWTDGNIVRSFKLDTKKIKALIDKAEKLKLEQANTNGIYGGQLYTSPYQRSSNTKEMYSIYGTVRY